VDDLQLTPEEHAAVTAFGQRVRKDPRLPSLSDDMLVPFMMARKFDEDRAYELLKNSLKWRDDRDIGLFLPMNPAIVSELKTKKILIPPQSRDKEGSQVVYYRPGLARKHGTKSEDFCLSVFFLLQKCIRDPLTQRRGFLFICDLRGTKLLQVDRKLVKSTVDMLSNKFPARLKKVLLLEPPSFFNIAFRIIRPLIPSKYMEKLAPARLAELQDYVDACKLLPDYGGTLPFDQSTYVDELWAEEQTTAAIPHHQQVLSTTTITPTSPHKLDAKPSISPPADVLGEGVATL